MRENEDTGGRLARATARALAARCRTRAWQPQLTVAAAARGQLPQLTVAVGGSSLIALCGNRNAGECRRGPVDARSVGSAARELWYGHST